MFKIDLFHRDEDEDDEIDSRDETSVIFT